MCSPSTLFETKNRCHDSLVIFCFVDKPHRIDYHDKNIPPSFLEIEAAGVTDILRLAVVFRGKEMWLKQG